MSSKWLRKWLMSCPGRSFVKLPGLNSCCTELVDAHQMSHPSSVSAGCHPLASKFDVMTTLFKSLLHRTDIQRCTVVLYWAAANPDVFQGCSVTINMQPSEDRWEQTESIRHVLLALSCSVVTVKQSLTPDDEIEQLGVGSVSTTT